MRCRRSFVFCFLCIWRQPVFDRRQMHKIRAQTGQWAIQQPIHVTRGHRLQGGGERCVGWRCVKIEGLEKADKLPQRGAACPRNLPQQLVDTVPLL